MATIYETSTQAQTITLRYLLPIIDESTVGTAIERRRWQHA
jgi:hypothetical protein